MKHITLYILIAFIANGCLGQYPKSVINEKGKVYNSHAQTKDTIYTTMPLYIPIQFDSTKIYWKKFTYWQNKMNAELNKLNRTGHANDISKSLLRFQDSAIFYKTLLDSLKSK